METGRRNYCTECEWSANEADLTRNALNTAAIEHFAETNHDIDSEVIEIQEPRRGWAEEWPP